MAIPGNGWHTYGDCATIDPLSAENLTLRVTYNTKSINVNYITSSAGGGASGDTNRSGLFC